MEQFSSPEQQRDPYERVPEELKAIPQWVCFRIDEEGRKLPVNARTRGNAMVNEPNTWNSYEKATETAGANGYGVGFVLTENDPYTCIDLDHCLDDGYVPDEFSRYVLDMLQGYVELSPSETGLHVWIKSEVPVNRRTKGLEIYSSGRWMTITGRSNPACPTIVRYRTFELQDLVEEFFPKVAEEPDTYNPNAYPVPESDNEIWQILFNSKKGNGEVYKALFDGDLSHTMNDHSRGVIFLGNMLAMITKCDPVRMKALLYQTNLVNDKWSERRGNTTWIDLTINDCIQWASQRGK